MTQAYRPLDEQWLLQVQALTRRVQALERAATALTFDIAQASANLTLTSSAQTIPGCSLTISRPGRYLILGTWRAQVTTTTAGSFIVGQFNPGGAATNLPTGADALLSTVALTEASISGIKAVTWTAPGNIVMQALLSGAGPAGAINASGYTRIAAIRTGPA